MNRLKQHIISAITEKDNTAILLFFRKTIYIVCLIEILFLIPDIQLLLSENNLFPKLGLEPFPAMGYVVGILRGNQYLWPIFIGAFLFGISTPWIKKFEKFGAFLVWFCHINIFYSIHITETSGHQLMNVFLFFMMFVNTKESERILKTTCINNGVFWLLRIQVILSYFVACLYKLQSEYWLDGSAIEKVANTQLFGYELTVSLPTGLLVSLTYISFVYQLLFPVLVWIKPIKKWFLLLGIGMHLAISFTLGLTEFGIIMIVAYVLFLDKPLFHSSKWN